MRMSSRVSEVDKFVNSFDGQTTERIYLIKYSLLIYNDEGEKLCSNGALESFEFCQAETVHDADAFF